MFPFAVDQLFVYLLAMYCNISLLLGYACILGGGLFSFLYSVVFLLICRNVFCILVLTCGLLLVFKVFLFA